MRTRPCNRVEDILLRELRATRFGMIVNATEVRKEVNPAALRCLAFKWSVALFEVEVPRMKRDDERSRRAVRVVVRRNDDIRRLERIVARAANEDALPAGAWSS